MGRFYRNVRRPDRLTTRTLQRRYNHGTEYWCKRNGDRVRRRTGPPQEDHVCRREHGGHVTTVFAGGTPTAGIGFIGSTTNATGYASALVTTAIGFIAIDDLATTANIMQTVETTVTCTPATGATSGEAYVIVMFTTSYPQA
jgi:hypothetical protein